MEAGYEKFKTIPYPFSYVKKDKKKSWLKKLVS
jgi:hypothetical protein